MKHKFLTTEAIIATIMAATSCRSLRSGSTSRNASNTVKAKITSYNELTMDLGENAITYTIDVSTADGKIKLNKLSLHQAEELALTEAVMNNNCAALFNPQFTHLKKGKKILRVTVYGFPAYYKRKAETKN